MTRSRFLVAALAAGALASPAAAATPFTSSFTVGAQWNSIYAQGFAPSINVTPDPGFTPTTSVSLDRFQFFKSGLVDGASNIRLAIVDNFFVNLDAFTTASVVPGGLSTNTIASTAAIPTGSPIVFNFSGLTLNYGDDYAAIYVNVSGTTLTPVLVASLIANYAETSPGSGVYRPTADYGDPDIDYQFSASNFKHTDSFGTFLDPFTPPPYGDATFVAVFNQPPPGDYYGDTHVNDADYVIWKGQFGQLGAGLAADGDADNDVDGADMLLWQRHYGDGPPATAASTGVPEPEAAVLAVVAAIVAHRRRRRPSPVAKMRCA